MAQKVAELYYAPDGSTLTALWVLTGAGRQLLKQGSIEVLRLEQERTGRHTTAFRRADEEARELLRHLEDAWRIY